MKRFDAGRTIVPLHTDTFPMVREIVQIQGKRIFFREDNLPEQVDEFWFPDSEFSLPRSERGFGLSMDGMELSRTLYEIASYAYGVPRMTIPWADVEDLIRLDGPAGALVAVEPAPEPVGEEQG